MSTETRIAPRGSTAPMRQDQAMAILTEYWPKAEQSAIIKAAILCRDFNLHPGLKQVFLIPFENKKTGNTDWEVVLGIGATRSIIQRSHSYGFVDDTPRLMADDEQKRIFGKVDAGNIWAIVKIKDRQGNEYPGYGSWPKEKTVQGGDKGNSPLNMAFIRAERNALNKMAPGELPDVDVTDESYAVPDFKASVENGKKVQSERAQEDIEDFWPEGAEKFDDNSAAPHLEKPKRTEAQIASIQTINQLYLALKTDFGLEPGDIFKELGIKDFTYLTEKPADAYRRVSAVRK